MHTKCIFRREYTTFIRYWNFEPNVHIYLRYLASSWGALTGGGPLEWQTFLFFCLKLFVIVFINMGCLSVETTMLCNITPTYVNSNDLPRVFLEKFSRYTISMWTNVCVNKSENQKACKDNVVFYWCFIQQYNKLCILKVEKYKRKNVLVGFQFEKKSSITKAHIRRIISRATLISIYTFLRRSIGNIIALHIISK